MDIKKDAFMIQFYVLQVKMGKMTIDQVPEKYREAVRKELEKDAS